MCDRVKRALRSLSILFQPDDRLISDGLSTSLRTLWDFLSIWRLLFKLLAIPMGQGGAGFIGALVKLPGEHHRAFFLFRFWALFSCGHGVNVMMRCGTFKRALCRR